MSLVPVCASPVFDEKVWGTTDLEPWFPTAQRKIGEVSFPGAEILVKFIFTSERLSVQVHPDDEQAAGFGLPRGKTEMWHILRTEPGARIALGFREPITRERLRSASLSGEVEHLLEWRPVQPGETYFVSAGTVHAIGAGIALCEIQQNSDVTFRLFDYGRPRELHLEQAVDVARLERHPGPAIQRPLPGGEVELALCPYFGVHWQRIEERCHCRSDERRGWRCIILRGRGTLAGMSVSPGQLWDVPASAEPFEICAEQPLEILRAFVP